MTVSHGAICRKHDAVDFVSWNGGTREGIFQSQPLLQKGVLRTNCIDCLDRTNVAQYAYGLAALGRQLHALGLTDVDEIDLESSLADDLVNLYEMMGDTLAIQYGGSGAHNKVLYCVFCKKPDFLKRFIFLEKIWLMTIQEWLLVFCELSLAPRGILVFIGKMIFICETIFF